MVTHTRYSCLLGIIDRRAFIQPASNSTLIKLGGVGAEHAELHPHHLLSLSSTFYCRAERKGLYQAPPIPFNSTSFLLRLLPSQHFLFFATTFSSSSFCHPLPQPAIMGYNNIKLCKAWWIMGYNNIKLCKAWWISNMHHTCWHMLIKEVFSSKQSIKWPMCNNP